jgi:Domain of unknown function (DUF4307)
MAGGTPLEQRYGRSLGPKPRRTWWALAAGFAAVGVVWAAGIGLHEARTPVRWQEGMFTALDAGHAQLRFVVAADPGRQVVCTVRIFNPGLTEVGRIDVPAGPSTQSSFTVTATVPTFELGSSGIVRACSVR